MGTITSARKLNNKIVIIVSTLVFFIEKLFKMHGDSALLDLVKKVCKYTCQNSHNCSENNDQNYITYLAHYQLLLKYHAIASFKVIYYYLRRRRTYSTLYRWFLDAYLQHALLQKVDLIIYLNRQWLLDL